MTDKEITGEEKYLVCMGYLHCLLDRSIADGNQIPATSLGQISAKLSLKFLNDTLEEHKESLERLKIFNVTEAIVDIMKEIKHES